MTNNNQAHKGVILKQTREAKGITLETVHEATKIPMDALRAIEEGYNVRILSPFYYKGFIKMYAQYLGIPPESVIDEKEEKRPKPPPEKPAPIRRPLAELKPMPKPDGDWKQKIAFWFSRRRQQQIAIAVGAIVLLFITVKIIGFMARSFRSKPPAVAQKPKAERKPKSKPAEKKQPQRVQEKVAPRVPVAAPAPTVAASPAPPAPSTVKSEPKAPSTEEINLTVRAKRNSWLQVRVDGVVVFQSTLSRGAVEDWTAKDKIEISGKDINDLEFELNGKLISSLGKADRQARRLIVTKDGMAIKR